MMAINSRSYRVLNTWRILWLEIQQQIPRDTDTAVRPCGALGLSVINGLISVVGFLITTSHVIRF